VGIQCTVEMKRLSIFPLLLLAMVLLCGAVDSLHGDDEGEQGEAVTHANATAKTEFAEVNIAIDPSATPLSCPLDIEIKNVGKEMLHITTSFGFPIFHFAVMDNDGRACPYTPAGSRMLGGTLSGSFQSVEIAPGGVHKFRILLEHYFAFKPGKWVLDSKIIMHGMARSDRSVRMPKMEFVVLESPPRETVEKRVHRFTGLDAISSIESMAYVPATDANVPFLNDGLKGQMGLKVIFRRNRFQLQPGRNVPGGRVHLFSALFDHDGDHLLGVRSAPDFGESIDIPSVEVTERGLQKGEQMFYSFPSRAPKITFLEALNVIDREGVGDPLEAKQITGYYVSYSRTGKYSRMRQVWVITFRGMGSITGRGYCERPIGRRVPRKLVTAVRNVVDARTGEWMSAEALAEFP